MMMSKDVIVNIAIIFELFIILLGELKSAAEKKKHKDNLNHKIIAVLIRHGGKMNCTGISRYLNLSIETVTVRMKELEKKKLICQNGDEYMIVRNSLKY